MSPQVGNFVHDLVEMAKAMDQLPILQSELDTVRMDNEKYLTTIQRLEMKLMERSAEIDKLHSRIRELEVQRDDAELRFLESDDAKSTVVRTLEGLQRDISGVLQAIAPPTPPPVEEPKVETVEQPVNVSEGQSVVDPISSADFHGGTIAEPQVASGTENASQSIEAGQSDSHPTHGNVSTEYGGQSAQPMSEAQETTLNISSPSRDGNEYGQEKVESVTHPTATATQQQENTTVSGYNGSGSAPSEAPQRSGPFVGKKYHDHPAYVTLSKWLEGGGTEADYLWRP